MAWTATGQVSAYGVAAPFSRGRLVRATLEPGRPAGNYGGMSAIFARFRVASASSLLTAVLALGAAPSPSAQRQASSPWAFEYVQFATPSDGWAMADNNDQSRFTELFTSHDGGRHWHNVTPPVVVAGENASVHNPLEPQTPFVLNSRDAWLPVSRLRVRPVTRSTCS